MKIERFEDIRAWKETRELVKRIYEVTDGQAFQRDYSLRDQIRRAAVSIMGNIAEGFDRQSNREFVRFLLIAVSSASELKSHLYVALDQKYIDEESFREIYDRATMVGKLINGFIGYLRKKKVKSD